MMMRNRLNTAQIPGDKEDSPFIVKMSAGGRIPSAQELLNMNPAKSGCGDKGSRSIWCSICPCWFPKWKSRFFVLIGNYLYRYKNEHGEKPKGVPIPLDSVTVKVKDSNCIEISTIRKVYTVRFESNHDATQWVQAITARKTQAIKESMGHASVSKDIDSLNRAAYALFERRVQQDGIEGSSEVNNPMSSMFPGGQ